VQRGPGLEDVEAEVAEQLAQRRGREEPDVVRARLEVLGEAAAAQGEGEQRAGAVVRRRDEQLPAGPQRAVHLRQPRREVDDVLEHLPRPRDVEARVGGGQRLARRPQAYVERRVALRRAAQRLAGDVDADGVRARLAQGRRELAGAAAEVEDVRAGRHVRQEPVPALGEALRDRAGRDVLPDRLGEVAHVARRARSRVQPP
jgi:hypothetical protein